MMNILKQIAANTERSEAYVAEADAVRAAPQPPVRLIAYYLPQFHPIPENDAWWGKGFTEWTNVSKALPRFEGHYQPRLPGELGFYDLRLPAILQRQAELARRHGIEGFCFHYYWFGGKRLLEAPLEMLLGRPDIDLPFCINWANENWSRRWDGNDQEILLGQNHSPEDDIAFAESLERLFSDPRYMRINGRPIMMLYRPGLLPDASATVARWREHFVRKGVGDPYILMTQAFGEDDPRRFGMDAAAGFPPHKTGWHLPDINHRLNLLDPKFSGSVKDYNEMAAAALANRPKDFKLFPGVCPDWDNEARKPGKGVVFSGASPKKYEAWLTAACRSVLPMEKEERIVFINAWNEWAEGAVLEPDRHFGYAYLSATAKALNALSDPTLRSSVPASYVALKQPSLFYRAIRKIAHKIAHAADAFADAIRLRFR